MTVQCAAFSNRLNPQNIDKTVSDILIRYWFPLQNSCYISVFGCILIILPDTQARSHGGHLGAVPPKFSCSQKN